MLEFWTPMRVAIAAALIFLGIVLWDVWLYHDTVRRNALSNLARDYDRKHRWFSLVIVFALGVLVGHVWPN